MSFTSWFKSLFTKKAVAEPIPLTPSPLPPNPIGVFLKISDISHYNGHVDWKAYGETDDVGTYCKASQYADFDSNDSTHDRNRAGAKSAGKAFGSYHFYHDNVDPVMQATLFLKVVGQLKETDMPCALDWENEKIKPTGDYMGRALIWLDMVEKATRKVPVIYSMPAKLQQLGLDSRFTRYALWIADPSNAVKKKPRLTPPWSADSWTLFQYSLDSAHVKGIPVETDLNYFNGDIEAFKTFCAFSS